MCFRTVNLSAIFNGLRRTESSRQRGSTESLHPSQVGLEIHFLLGWLLLLSSPTEYCFTGFTLILFRLL